MYRRLSAVLLAAVLAFGGVACGDPEDDELDAPAVTEGADDDTADTGDTGDTGGAGGTGASPGPVGSPDGTGDDDFDTGGGAIYDETPSVAPPSD